jgi:hypothetical protein
VITFTQERSTGDRPLIDMPHDRLPDPERIREFEFPDPRSDFPVPISRELSRKAQWPRGVFTPVDAEIAPENTKFPVFTLLIRELARRRWVRIRLRYPPSSPSPFAIRREMACGSRERLQAADSADDEMHLATIADEQADVAGYFRNRNLAAMLLRRTNH